MNTYLDSIKDHPSWNHHPFPGEFIILESGVASSSSTRRFSGLFARLMDHGQQYDMYGYGYSGNGIQRYKGIDVVHEYRPYHPPERRDAYEYKLMVSSLAHIHTGYPTGRPSLGGEVPYSQPGLGVSPLHSSYTATSPETSDKDYACSGTFSPRGTANGSGPAGSAFPDRLYRRRQENGTPGLIRERSEPISHPGERHMNSIGPYGSNTGWRPSASPMEQISTSFNDALNFPYLEASTTCASCRSYPYIDNLPFYHPDQGDAGSNMDWRVQGAKDYILPPTEGNVPSNQQLPNQNTRRIAPHNDRLDVPHLEQSESRFSRRKPATANAPVNPGTVHVEEDIANKGLTKKRKRRPRIIKPRKPRTLTEEGKAHAKAVRDCPGGACADCRKNKTKARDPPLANLGFQHAYNRT